MTASSRATALLVGSLIGIVIALVFAWALGTHSYNLWGGFVVMTVVVALNLVIIVRIARRPDEPWLPAMLCLALGVKLMGAVARYFVAFTVYHGVADASGYTSYAAAHSSEWRHGLVTWASGGSVGTEALRTITTAIYTVTGPSSIASFGIFAIFAFWGQYLLYRAFRISLPEANGRRYGLLVLFLPSMVYWPASIGKESWLLLFVGVTAFGAARLFHDGYHSLGAILLLATGAAGTALIRPHIALLLFFSILVAQLFRPTWGRLTNLLSKVVGLAVLGVMAWILLRQSASFLGIHDLTWQTISNKADWINSHTTQGGSEFTPVPLGSPWGVVAAIITLLFRPFPFEAGNVQILAQSVEGLFLMILTVYSWSRLRRLPIIMRKNAYVVFAVVYCIAFILAFSGFGNFGILARQRVLMMPFFLLLLALPKSSDPTQGGHKEDEYGDTHSGPGRIEPRSRQPRQPQWRTDRTTGPLEAGPRPGTTQPDRPRRHPPDLPPHRGGNGERTRPPGNNIRQARRPPGEP